MTRNERMLNERTECFADKAGGKVCAPPPPLRWLQLSIGPNGHAQSACAGVLQRCPAEFVSTVRVLAGIVFWLLACVIWRIVVKTVCLK